MWIKENGQWKYVAACYKKQNGAWVKISQEDLQQYAASGILLFPSESGIVQSTIKINGLSSVSGESTSYVAIFNKSQNVTTSATWAIVSGSQYATINQSGQVTVLSGASASSVVIGVSYEDTVAIKNVTLTYVSGSSSSTQSVTEVDESGNQTVTVTTVTTNADGSSQTNETMTNYDQYGTLVGSSEGVVNVNTDGSSVGLITNYDANGDETGHVGLSGDTEGNVNTRTVEKDNQGNDVVVGYNIDTSGNEGTGYETIDSGINTQFLPFVGTDGFAVYEDQPNPPVVPDTEDTTSLLYQLLGAKSPTSPYPGFLIRFTSADKNQLYCGYTMADGTKSNIGIAKTADGIYSLRVTYNPSSSTDKFVIYNKLTDTVIKSLNKTFANLNDMEVTIGYAVNQQGQPYRYSTLDVYEFNISKL